MLTDLLQDMPGSSSWFALSRSSRPATAIVLPGAFLSCLRASVRPRSGPASALQTRGRWRAACCNSPHTTFDVLVSDSGFTGYAAVSRVHNLR